MSDSEEEKGGALKLVEGLAKPLGDFLVFAIPLIISFGQKAVAFYNKLPQNMLMFLIGVIFCFFGGVYPTLFAAVQAAENGGRKAVMEAVGDLSEETIKIIEASKKDDDTDDDGDGQADVNQISGKEYMQRKTMLVLKKMNPEKIDKAMYSIYRVWLSVVAVLSLKFARTINMALSIAEFLNRPCDRFLKPIIQAVIPDDYDKWVPVVLRWITKSIAMSIAWYIESIISAFTSALIGGLIIGRSFCNFCLAHGVELGGLVKQDHNETMLDESLSYIFAAMGFYFQFSLGFSIPSPYNLVLWPFNFAEQYIRWSITKKTGIEV